MITPENPSSLDYDFLKKHAYETLFQARFLRGEEVSLEDAKKLLNEYNDKVGLQGEVRIKLRHIYHTIIYYEEGKPPQYSLPEKLEMSSLALAELVEDSTSTDNPAIVQTLLVQYKNIEKARQFLEDRFVKLN